MWYPSTYSVLYSDSHTVCYWWEMCQNPRSYKAIHQDTQLRMGWLDSISQSEPQVSSTLVKLLTLCGYRHKSIHVNCVCLKCAIIAHYHSCKKFTNKTRLADHRQTQKSKASTQPWQRKEVPPEHIKSLTVWSVVFLQERQTIQRKGWKTSETDPRASSG